MQLGLARTGSSSSSLQDAGAAREGPQSVAVEQAEEKAKKIHD